MTVDTVRYWSDYSRVFYHPRSIVQINDYELASSIQPFERWESGEELFQTLDREEGILDRDVRRWIEECDLLQGVQVVMGADDAWGGFGSRMVEVLRDEMDKGVIWAWAVEEQAGTGSRVRAFSSHPSRGLCMPTLVERVKGRQDLRERSVGLMSSADTASRTGQAITKDCQHCKNGMRIVYAGDYVYPTLDPVHSAAPLHPP